MVECLIETESNLNKRKMQYYINRYSYTEKNKLKNLFAMARKKLRQQRGIQE